MNAAPGLSAGEIEFLLTHAARYLTKDPTPSDVLSTFAGLRPLVRSGNTEETSAIPRDHTILISKSGLVSVTGGKWTTYRKMAEDTINQAITAGGLHDRPTRTTHLRLHGWTGQPDLHHPLAAYGSERDAVLALARENPSWKNPVHPLLPCSYTEIIWAIRHEMARTVEDLLSRRTRALLLNARAAIEAAPAVAQLLASELGRDPAWAAAQCTAFQTLAKNYLLT